MLRLCYTAAVVASSRQTAARGRSQTSARVKGWHDVAGLSPFLVFSLSSFLWLRYFPSFCFGAVKISYPPNRDRVIRHVLGSFLPL